MKRLSDLVQDPAGWMRRALVAAAWALLFGLAALPARSETLPAHSCAVPHQLLNSANKLPRVAKKLQRGEPIKVVALGSSSTAGIGASVPKATYPSQFRAELQHLFPRSKITIVNKGIAGEDAMQMLGRFQRDVLDEHPDLLIWQTGTNSALHHDNVTAYSGKLTHGIDQAHAAGIDVLLMGPQFSPKFEAVPNHQAFLDHIAAIASVRRVPVLPRYQIMKYWVDSGEMTQAEMVNPDGLHQTDRSYHCLGIVAAHMVADLAEHPALTSVPIAHKTP